MLYEDNPIINYKKETVSSLRVLVKSSAIIGIFAVVIAFIFYKPFIAVNNRALELASEYDQVKSRIDFLDTYSKKINKGKNYLTYSAGFFWNKRDSQISLTNGYEKKFSNIIMNHDRTTGKVFVDIQKVPDISCSAFADYIKSKHGNVIVKDSSGAESACPAMITSLLSSQKYTLSYIL